MGLVTHPVRKSRAAPKKESIIFVFIMFLLLLFRWVEARENVLRKSRNGGHGYPPCYGRGLLIGVKNEYFSAKAAKKSANVGARRTRTGSVGPPHP
jgi:hypothetical protein